MATIQVRDVPDDVHRTYRRRAAAAGMSLQEFLRKELVRNAQTRTPAELVAAIDADLARQRTEDDYAHSSSATTVRDDRDAR